MKLSVIPRFNLSSSGIEACVIPSAIGKWEKNPYDSGLTDGD